MCTTGVKIGIIGGSGLSKLSVLEDQEEEHVNTPFGKPSDALISGKIKGVECVFLARHGRKHTIMPTNVNYCANIWALKMAGCTHLLASTACGSLQTQIAPGDLVILDSFIDRTTKRIQTFYDGTKENLPGICHLPMDAPFCPHTRQILLDSAEELGFKVHPTGTCLTVEGPRFSSKAESFLFKSWGAHVINMTIVPEVVLAKEAGLCYAAVAMATDYDCWHETEEKVNVESVMKTFKENSHKVTKMFKDVVPKIAEKNWTTIIEENKKLVQNNILLQH